MAGEYVETGSCVRYILDLPLDSARRVFGRIEDYAPDRLDITRIVGKVDRRYGPGAVLGRLSKRVLIRARNYAIGELERGVNFRIRSRRHGNSREH